MYGRMYAADPGLCRYAGSCDGRTDILPVSAAVFRDLEIAVVGTDIEKALFLGRLADGRDGSVGRRRLVLGNGLGAPDAAHHGQLVAVELPRQVPADRAPAVAAIIAAVPIDRIVEQIDIDAIIARVDVDALIRRVDVDGIVARVDVNRIMERVDIAPMASEVLDTIDIGSIVRESTGSVTGDIVDSARVQSMQLDTLVNRIVDTILLRRRRHRAHVGDDWAVGRRGSDDPAGAADDEAVGGGE